MRALLGRGQAACVARLAVGDMLSAAEAAALTGANVASIDALIAEGHRIGLPQPKGGFQLPSWQVGHAFLPVVPKLAKALSTTEGWALLAFLESPHGALDGARRRAAIERGQGERVLAIARREV
jgi:hypothetical protein